MQHELLPKAGVAIALLIGAAGVLSYFGGSAASQPKSDASAKVQSLRSEGNQPPKNQHDVRAQEPQNTELNAEQPPVSNISRSTNLQREAPPKSSTEAVYYCGAMTRNGTPCTRRVKTKGRCWQHIGQPLAEEVTKVPPRR